VNKHGGRRARELVGQGKSVIQRRYTTSTMLDTVSTLVRLPILVALI
jgi:hypothetical protein